MSDGMTLTVGKGSGIGGGLRGNETGYSPILIFYSVIMFSPMFHTRVLFV